MYDYNIKEIEFINKELMIILFISFSNIPWI